MNVFSFLTFNVAGDDENVFMHIVKKDLADYEANQGQEDARQGLDDERRAAPHGRIEDGPVGSHHAVRAIARACSCTSRRRKPRTAS